MCEGSSYDVVSDTTFWLFICIAKAFCMCQIKSGIHSLKITITQGMEKLLARVKFKSTHQFQILRLK